MWLIQYAMKLQEFWWIFPEGRGIQKILKKSAEIIALIEDDYLRQYRLAQIGFEDALENSVPHTKIMSILTRINNGGAYRADYDT